MALIQFENGFHGYYEVKGQKIRIGSDGLEPYDLTYGAIGACLYSNLLRVAEERGITLPGAQVCVEGRKRAEIPTVLEYLKIRVFLGGDTSIEMRECLEEASRTCSMLATFSKVAEIDVNLSALPFRDVSKTSCSVKKGNC
jgi:uncharacterized OsmC-like protein